MNITRSSPVRRRIKVKRRIGGRYRPTRRHGRSSMASAKMPLIAVAGVAALLGGFALVGHLSSGPATAFDSTPGGMIIYTAPGNTDGIREMPAELINLLLELGRQNRSVELVQLAADGSAESQTIDLTPRVNGKPDAPKLTVTAEMDQQIMRDIEEKITQEINRAKPTTDGRATYLGLVTYHPPSDKVGPDTPVYIFSNLMDTVAPTSLDKVAWQQEQADKVLSNVMATGDIPTWFEGRRVTFVVTPVAGDQIALRPGQRMFLESFWTDLAQTGNPANVRFVDGPGVNTAVAYGPIPAIEVPGVPDIEPVPSPDVPGEYQCDVPATTHFTVLSATNRVTEFKDKASLIQALEPCVAVIQPGAKVHLGGWATWEFCVDELGAPVTDGFDLTVYDAVSQQRADMVKDLLITDLGVTVPIEAVGHGVGNLPYQPASSANNAVVLITITNP